MTSLESLIAASTAVLEELHAQRRRHDLDVAEVYLIANLLVEIVEERMIPERNNE